MSKAQAQITISSLFDGETPVSLSLRSSGDTLQHNTDQPVPMSAEGWQGGQKLSDQELLALGTLRWYLDHGDTPAAEGLTFSVKPSDASHAEVRLEQDWETVSGNPVTFSSPGGALKRLRLHLSPAQSGTGDPGPTNVRPITVFPSVTLTLNGTDVSLAFPAEAGAVCGGSVDLPAGTLTADRLLLVYDGGENWRAALEAGTFYIPAPESCRFAHTPMCDTLTPLAPGASSGLGENQCRLNARGTNLLVRPGADITTVAALKASLEAQPISVLYELREPQAYSVEPVALTAVAGENTVSSDAGSLELIAASETLAWAEQSLASVYDGAPGEPGEDGRSSYLHVKYSDDGGQSFTDNQGEDLGAWIGTCVDFEQTDPGEVTAYTWKRFADDTELRGLLDYVEEHCDRLEQSLHQDYVAVSDFGSYREEIDLSVEATARRVVESYEYQEAIAAVAERCGGLDSALTRLSGQIRRGLITDPETGETALGIAISQQLSFTGATVEREGLRYYELSPGSTLGLYTATGWQFWINGSKRGWFDSADGMLHVTNLAADSSLRLGGDWLLTADGGLGIRKL